MEFKRSVRIAAATLLVVAGDLALNACAEDKRPATPTKIGTAEVCERYHDDPGVQTDVEVFASSHDISLPEGAIVCADYTSNAEVVDVSLPQN